MIEGAWVLLMVRLKLAVEDALSFPVTLMVKLLVPGDVGVPVITPLLPRVNPGGKVPEAKDQV